MKRTKKLLYTAMLCVLFVGALVADIGMQPAGCPQYGPNRSSLSIKAAAFQDTLQRKKPSAGTLTIEQWKDSLRKNLEEDDASGIAKSHYQLARLNKNKENAADAVAHYLMARDRYQQLSQHNKEIEALNEIAALYYQKEQLAQALNYAQQAHQLAHHISDDSLIAASAFQLAKVYDGLGQEDRAAHLYNVAINYYEQIKRSHQLADIYHFLAESHEDAGRISNTIRYHKKALDIRQDIGDSSGLGDSYHELGLAFAEKDDVDLAIQHLHQAARIREQLNRPTDAARSYIEIGMLHAEHGNMDSSLEYANRALDLADNFKAINVKVDAMRLALRAHAALGHTDRVSVFQQELDELQDSLETLREKERQKEMIFQIDVNQKVDKLKELQEKHEVQQAKLKREHLLLIFSLIALIFLGVILVLLYSRYQYRKHTEAATKEKNTQLERLNSRLEALNEEKNELMQTVTHDLKNPLTGIMGLSNLAQMEKDDISREELLEYMEQIATVARQMNDMIKKLLDIRSIESGDNSLEIEPENIVNVTKDVIRNNNQHATDKDIDLIFNPGQPELQVMADRTAVARVLDNFISNAIKYSPKGKNVYVDAFRRNGHVRVEVRDEGPGLSDSDQEKLFSKFSRLAPQPTGDETSTGLGLYIAKELTEQMNGSIGCESEQGQGSTFYVELPAGES